jgi:excisionase family DNA binding protein
MMPDQSHSSDFQTIAELARRWRVSQNHLYGLIKRQELRAVRIGGRLIVHQAEVKDFLARNSTLARAA